MVGRQSDGRLASDVRPLLAVSIRPGGLPAIRLEVARIARDLGLSADRASDWVTAVNEVMANAVRHGGGTAELRVWVDGDLVCEVRDQGPGFVADPYLHPRDRPVPSSEGGLGLWIARRMSDDMRIDSGPAGTVVRLRARMDARA